MLKDCAAIGCAQRAELDDVFCPYHLGSLPDDVVAAIRRVNARYPTVERVLTQEWRDAVERGVALIREAEEGVPPHEIRAVARALAARPSPATARPRGPSPATAPAPPQLDSLELPPPAAVDPVSPAPAPAGDQGSNPPRHGPTSKRFR